MRFVRFGKAGEEKPGILDSSGNLRDLSGVIPDLHGVHLDPRYLKVFVDPSYDIDRLPRVSANPRLGPPVSGGKNFIGIGLNYADHAAETGSKIPAEPIIFTKSLGCIVGPNDDVVIPEGSKKTDWEAELAVIMGRTARSVTVETALDYVAGYTICLDVSEREWQNERGGSWDKGKGFDTFGPIGPWLLTADELPDPQTVSINLDIDGRRMQTGNTATMIFTVKQLIAYVSRCITLHPGDIIATGTPPGVGIAQKPHPIFLAPGQVVRLELSKLGTQTHNIVSASK